MIKQGLNNDILEKKFKILRTSIMLGNIKNREEMLNTYEETARDVDNIRQAVYEELLAGKEYTTTTLPEEEERLANLINFIENRINERNEFVDDYIKITNNFLDNLPKIPKEDELDDYRIRLANIQEYLNNSKEIEELNIKLKNLRDRLEEKYESKASNEIINSKLEDELIDEFNKFVTKDEYYSSLNYMDIDTELIKIESNLNDKKEVMNTFISSYEALKNAGISGAEREEYLSYVSDARNDYYQELEKKYILNIYKLVLDKQNNYDLLYQKRENIDNILEDRLNKRYELEITNRDELDYFIKLCNEQFSVIKSQKVNIENIDKLILEISECENRLDELDKANNRDEILTILNEFSVDRQEIEKVELPKEEEIQEEVIKKNNLEEGSKPANMVVKISEPIKMNIRNASDTAKLVMKKVVIVLEPKKFNSKRDKLAEAERELALRKEEEEKLKQQEEKKDELFVTLDANNNTEETTDDIFINTNDDVTLNIETDGNNEVKIDIPDNNQVSIPTEILIEEPKEEKLELFKETDPFLDDNEFELSQDEKDEVVSSMPEIKNIGTVKPNSILSQIEKVAEDNTDIILPTNGLTNNEKVDVPIVSENYIQ